MSLPSPPRVPTTDLLEFLLHDGESWRTVLPEVLLQMGRKDPSQSFTEITEFEYVLGPRNPDKIFFGSGCPRTVLENIITRQAAKYCTFRPIKLGPGAHKISRDISSPRPTSIYGVGPGARRTERFQYTYPNVPSPLKYNIRSFPAKVTPSKSPFNVSSKRFKTIERNVPGPGTYSLNETSSQLKFRHTFGGRKLLDFHVHVKCMPENRDFCQICNGVSSGDYWTYKFKEYICFPCMEKIKRQKKHKIPKWKIDQFKKIRPCFFMHHHEGTQAYVTKLDKKKVRQLQVRETYLSQFFT